jgi:hypothetical protein
MAQETKPLPYKEFVEHIDEHLDALEAPAEEVTFEKDGRVFHVYAETKPKRDIWSGYSPERMREIIERRAGNVLKGVDTKKLWRDIKAARGQDSIGRPGD